MYSHVLVPVADDEVPERTDAALAVARLIMAPGAKLTILHVREAIPGYIAPSIPPETLEEAERQAHAMVEAVAARAGPPAEPVVVTGHGGGAILRHAGRTGADCIVINSHRPEFQDVLFGSTAAHVVRHATCAVHVLR